MCIKKEYVYSDGKYFIHKNIPVHCLGKVTVR